jgi:hypothetical protein
VASATSKHHLQRFARGAFSSEPRFFFSGLSPCRIHTTAPRAAFTAPGPRAALRTIRTCLFCDLHGAGKRRVCHPQSLQSQSQQSLQFLDCWWALITAVIRIDASPIDSRDATPINQIPIDFLDPYRLGSHRFEQTRLV